VPKTLKEFVRKHLMATKRALGAGEQLNEAEIPAARDLASPRSATSRSDGPGRLQLSRA
jgi:hypothetical protein